jgi:hypothetical protein
MTTTFADWLVTFSAAFMAGATLFFIWTRYRRWQDKRAEEIEDYVQSRLQMERDSHPNIFDIAWQRAQRPQVQLTKEGIHTEAEQCRDSEHISQEAYERICKMLDENDLNGAYLHLQISHMK